MMQDPNDVHAYDLSPLPPWSLGLTEDDPDLDAWSSLGVLSTVTNGDCFFHAVHLGLLSCFPHSALSTSDLRMLVAGSVFCSLRDSTVRAILKEWRDILVQAVITTTTVPAGSTAATVPDDAILREFRHALPLLTDATVMDIGVLSAVYHAMVDRRRYWADNYAVLMLQQILGIHLIVLGEPGFVHPPTRCRPLPDDFCIILVNDSNTHYRVCVTRHHRVAAFRWRNIPRFIQRQCEARWQKQQS